MSEEIKRLADEYAHCYSFVEDDTMPRKRAELHAAIDALAAAPTPPVHPENIVATKIFVNESGRLETQYLSYDEVYLSPEEIEAMKPGAVEYVPAPSVEGIEPVGFINAGYFKDRTANPATAYGTISALRNWSAQSPLYSAEQLATLLAKLEQADKDKKELVAKLQRYERPRSSHSCDIEGCAVCDPTHGL